MNEQKTSGTEALLRDVIDLPSDQQALGLVEAIQDESSIQDGETAYQLAVRIGVIQGLAERLAVVLAKREKAVEQLQDALDDQCKQAKWAWQFISAVASDSHNREHNSRNAERVALCDCPEAPCPGWWIDLQHYKAVIAVSDAVLAKGAS